MENASLNIEKAKACKHLQVKQDSSLLYCLKDTECCLASLKCISCNALIPAYSYRNLKKNNLSYLIVTVCESCISFSCPWCMQEKDYFYQVEETLYCLECMCLELNRSTNEQKS